jgi:hypothetical protein
MSCSHSFRNSRVCLMQCALEKSLIYELKQPTSMIVTSPTEDLNRNSQNDVLWKERDSFRNTLPSQLDRAILPALVLLSSQLTLDEYRRLVPSLWARHLDSKNAAVLGPVS